jgi:surfeit locus 1 family protein
MPAERKRLVILVAALAVALLTARLGYWQLQRADLKLALQAAQQAADRKAPVTSDQLGEFEEHRLARIEGRWQPSHQIWLSNRPMAGRVGFVLVTPLRLDNGHLLWVQRGWHARTQSNFEAPAWPPTVEDRVLVMGRLARQASRAYELGSPASGSVRQNLDLSETLGIGDKVLPWVLWQSDNCAPLLCNWPPPDLGVSKHHGYAAQWFALSALTIGLYVWFQIFPRRRQREQNAA